MQHVPGLAPGEGVILSSYVRRELRDALDELAQRHERSLSAEARFALREYVTASRAQAETPLSAA